LTLVARACLVAGLGWPTLSLAGSPVEACSLPLVPGGGGLADVWAVDGGEIGNVIIADGMAYVGGDIKVVGPATGPAALVDLVTAQVIPGFPKITGPNADLDTVISDGEGGWYVAGDFTAVGGVARNRLARVLSDGSVDPGFDPGVDDEIQAMALADGVLYVGGSYSMIGGQSRTNLAALDPDTGAVSAWNPAPNSSVGAIVVQGGTVFVSGRFSAIGGQSRNLVAALDAGTGAAHPWNANVGGGNRVAAMALDGSTLFIGGVFTTVGGSSRRNLAAVDTVTAVLMAGIRALRRIPVPISPPWR